MRRLCALMLLLVSLGAHAGIPVGAPMPAWEARGASGETFAFAAGERSRPALVVFWATYCRYCKLVMNEVAGLATELGGERLEVIAVSVYEHPGADPVAALEQRGHDFTPVLEGDAVAQRFDVQGTPVLYLVDRSGVVRYRRQGSAPPGTVASELRSLLADPSSTRR